VHRDVKPENILLGGGHARVADFGTARAVTAAGGKSLTETGLAIGTAAYMSPEQAFGGRKVDARTDVYSLGCVLYEMLAGHPPYTGATPEAILARKSLEAVPSLRVVRETVPAAVEQAVAKALAKVPADRFGSALQFAEALEKGGATAPQAASFHRAIAIDSAEPLAYAGLALGYSLLEVLTAAPSPDAIPRAKAAALMAVKLDETLAEAHDALSEVRSAEWDYAGAEQSLRRALELNPNLPEPHIHNAWHLSIFGSEAESIAEMKRGIELDPLSPLYTAWLGGLYWEFGRFDEAITEAHKALELQPDFPVALYVLGLAHADKGQYQEAIAAHQKALAKYPNRNFSWSLARTYAVAGRTADARKIIGRFGIGPAGRRAPPLVHRRRLRGSGGTREGHDVAGKGLRGPQPLPPQPPERALCRPRPAAAAHRSTLPGTPAAGEVAGVTRCAWSGRGGHPERSEGSCLWMARTRAGKIPRCARDDSSPLCEFVTPVHVPVT
jgi:tetratricopeptide (TPR) repeat protein